MPEFTPRDRQQQFDTILPMAQAASPGEAWYTADFNANTFEVWRLNSSEVAGRISVNNSYWHWNSHAPDQVTPRQHDRVGRYWDPTKGKGSQLSVARLVGNFVRRAANADELTNYLQPLENHTHLGNIPRHLLFRSFVHPDNPFLQPDSPLVQFLASGSPGSKKLVEGLADYAGKYLVGNFKEAGAWQRDYPDHRQALVDILTVLDDHQLVPMDFWYSYGVKAKLVFQWPELLEITLKNLATPAGMEALRRQKISNPTTTIKDYIYALLTSYAADEKRNQTKMREAIEGINTPLGGIILGRLISIGAGVTKVMNENLRQTYSAEGEDLLSDLDPNQTIQVGEALFRILESFRLPNLSADKTLWQRQQDSLHTGLIETLHMALLKGKLRRSVGDVRLHLGSEADIRELMGELPPGMFPSEVASHIRSKRRNSSSPVRAHPHYLKKPGSGLVS